VSNDNFDTSAVFRTKNDDLQSFKAHCKLKLNRNYTDVLREMMIASTQGRLKITPTDEQIQAHGELYDVD
jgi:hypothetical protein